jgi:hypothetical protein
MIIAHGDERLGEDVGQIERGFAGKRRRCVVDALAAGRRLVEDEGKRFLPGSGEMKRRCGCFDVGEAGPRRNDAQIAVADRRRGCGADAAGAVDDRQRHAAALDRLQAVFDIVGAVNGLDNGFGDAAAALPIRQRALRVGLDQADCMSGLFGG